MSKHQRLLFALALILWLGAGWLRFVESPAVATAFVAYSPIQPGAAPMASDILSLRSEIEKLVDEDASVTITQVSISYHRIVITVDQATTVPQITEDIQSAITALTQSQRQLIRNQLTSLETLLSTHRQAVLQRKLEIETEAWPTDTLLMTLQQRVTQVEIQLFLAHEELDAVTSEFQLTQVIITPQLNVALWLFGLGAVIGGLALVWRGKPHD
jgi:hypothetical protein